jgi:hypothetical protein
LLQAIREMKAGKAARVRKVSTSRKRQNAHLGESFDTFLKEQPSHGQCVTPAPAYELLSARPAVSKTCRSYLRLRSTNGISCSTDGEYHGKTHRAEHS